MTDAYVWDSGTPEACVAGQAETREILQEVDATFRQRIRHLIYSHKVSVLLRNQLVPPHASM